MSIQVKVADSVVMSKVDTEETEYSYSTSDGGVLRVLSSPTGENSWSVMREFSPTGWGHVVGKRFVGDTAALGGSLATTRQAVNNKIHSF